MKKFLCSLLVLVMLVGINLPTKACQEEESGAAPGSNSEAQSNTRDRRPPPRRSQLSTGQSLGSGNAGADLNGQDVNQAPPPERRPSSRPGRPGSR